ncbi:hypothetical protein EJ07DRAFT_160288 [Lizonia empirigonia]|nr:hypothetical protein EJ07DRAFT_160288 [Lizonia empirigonia]
MPSHVFANPTHEVGELTGPDTHSDRKSFASPVLATVEDEPEMMLDFQGYKHVDNSDDGDQVYTLQHDLSSSHTMFTMPGQATANTLREYLVQHLRADQIVDEYGNEHQMSDISNDHLSVLQAKLWTKVPSDRSPTKTSNARPLRTQVVVAGHVAKIRQLLEERHIFVLDTRRGTCQYLDDSQETTHHSQIVRLEPLIHWGTVTPGSASQAMVLFRRDGGLMEEPAYKMLVRRSIDTEAATYCVNCLGYLWSKRAEARHMRQQLHSSDVHQTDLQHIFKHFSSTIRSGAVHVGESMEPTSSQIKPIAAKSTGVVSKKVTFASCQLDGTADMPYTAEHAHPNINDDQSHGAVWILSNAVEDEHNHYTRPSPLPRPNSFTVRTTPLSPNIPHGSLLPRDHTCPKPAYSTAPPTNTANERRLTDSEFTKNNKYRVRLGVQTPPRAKRTFGRELDVNCALRTSPRKHMKGVSKSQERLRVRPMKPLNPRNKTMDETNKAKRKDGSTSTPPSNSKTPPSPQSQDTPTSSPPPELTIHLAKRPPQSNPNTTTSDPLDPPPLPFLPNFQSKICTCNRPASQPPTWTRTKPRTPPQIAQCANPSCRFVWYHYTCLSQSDKGKARRGTLVCLHCRNEEDFKRGDGMDLSAGADAGWEGAVGNDAVQAMPGPGGWGAVVDPYGLASGGRWGDGRAGLGM